MTDELKPCPFCNRHLVEYPNFSTRSTKHFAHPLSEGDEEDCIITNIVIHASERSEDLERIAKWNNRAPEPVEHETDVAIATRTFAAQGGWPAATNDI